MEATAVLLLRVILILLGFSAGYLQQLVTLATQILAELESIRVAVAESNEKAKNKNRGEVKEQFD